MVNLENSAAEGEIPHQLLNSFGLGRIALRAYYLSIGAKYEVRESGWSASRSEDEWTAVVKTSPGYIGRLGRRINKVWCDFMNSAED